MNKSTINYLLLVIGIVLLIWGFYSFWDSDKAPVENKAPTALLTNYQDISEKPEEV